MKSFALNLVFFLLLGATFGIAQTHTVNGRIIAFKKYPVNKVKVSSKRAKTFVYSDSLGIYSISCNKNDQLVFNASGFQNQRIKLKGQDSLLVNLVIIESELAYDEVVKGKHLSQSKLDYCLNNLIDNNNNYDKLGTIFEVIQFVYPQAKITEEGPNQNDNANTFGTTGRQVILDVRALKSVIASPYALLVVDGIVTSDISGISPEQVKTVKVLSAAESGHWGTRGGNGVVEITLRP